SQTAVQGTPTPNAKNFGVIRATASGEQSIWINGNKTGTRTNSGFGDLSKTLLQFGHDFGTATWTGDMDEVGYWFRSLSDAEIVELYNNGDGLNFSNESSSSQNITVTLTSPLNNTQKSDATVFFNATITSQTTHAILNNTLFLWNATGVIKNISLGSPDAYNTSIISQSVAYFSFNGDANDESPSSRNGTVSGATLTTDRGQVENKAYNFSNVNDYISFNYTNTTSYTDGLTLSAWIAPKGSCISTTCAILDKSSNINGASGFFWFYGATNRRMTFRINSGAAISSPINSLPALSESNWSFVSVTSFANGTTNFYVNGLNVGGATTGALTGITTQNLTRIGNNAHEPFSSFNGSIDEVLIIDRALSAEEIKDLFSNEKKVTLPASDLPLGTYQWNILACGLSNDLSRPCSFDSENNTFTQQRFQIDDKFSLNSVLDTDSSVFILNITVTNGSNLYSANLNYSGIIYPAIITSQDNISFSILLRNIDIPVVQTSVQNSFFWNIALDIGNEFIQQIKKLPNVDDDEPVYTDGYTCILESYVH
ncbi:MAG: LamG domain-containing protein, partial [Candidatus Paceibacterota bacterium]